VDKAELEERTQVVERGIVLLRYVQQFNAFVLLVLVAAGWYFFSWQMARSILIGGAIATGSFFMLQRDIKQFMAAFEGVDLHWQAVKRIEKIKFFVRFYGRLTVLGLLIFVIITKIDLNILGLLVGLSTIMLSVIIVVLAKAKTIFSVKEG